MDGCQSGDAGTLFSPFVKLAQVPLTVVRLMILGAGILLLFMVDGSSLLKQEK
ncbi:hypothetical protein [Halalkalibacterium halodurans]|uniref:hypothetical protein n=1 Tax=Halalkalibacterium halodurans TaxID=86665 RepID=UPI002AA9924E|nr:hypothetical protein [Halalkalibacterium halodurans]MDY7224172.1 hypothetical protein [Halalkalibacterium halodurans]MDY7243457.1 hypothetical protein [Halalkalibacterium halodurans]